MRNRLASPAVASSSIPSSRPRRPACDVGEPARPPKADWGNRGRLGRGSIQKRWSAQAPLRRADEPPTKTPKTPLRSAARCSRRQPFSSKFQSHPKTAPTAGQERAWCSAQWAWRSSSGRTTSHRDGSPPPPGGWKRDCGRRPGCAARGSAAPEAAWAGEACEAGEPGAKEKRSERSTTTNQRARPQARQAQFQAKVPAPPPRTGASQSTRLPSLRPRSGRRSSKGRQPVDNRTPGGRAVSAKRAAVGRDVGVAAAAERRGASQRRSLSASVCQACCAAGARGIAEVLESPSLAANREGPLLPTHFHSQDRRDAPCTGRKAP